MMRASSSAGAQRWQSSDGAAAPRRLPTAWALLGDKLGDNQQVEVITNALAARLGWRVEVRRLRFKGNNRRPHFQADRDHLDCARSDELNPPWPDVVLTIGRLPSMVALWLKDQSAGQTRIVIVGRPRRYLKRFDLIVAAAHHHVPPMRNVVRHGLPLVSANPAALSEARSVWGARFESMSRPLFALLVGGPAKPHLLDPAIATDLMSRVTAATSSSGGSLWVCTSPRTPPAVVNSIEQALPPGGGLYRWQPNSPENPYLGLLACADRFIVTGDSVSMQVTVARLGKPLAIYALPSKFDLSEHLRRVAARAAYGRRKWPLLSSAIQRLQSLGAVRFQRDVEEIHALLYERGLAVPLGEPFLNAARTADVDVDEILERIGCLVR